MPSSFDIAIVGAGIVGLSHAWMAARRGLRVIVFDRTSVAQGATVRNFGMVWPIGQPLGDRRDLALRSRQLWLEAADAQAVSVERCGSIHVAFREDEYAVMREYCHQVDTSCTLLTAAEVLERSDLVREEGLLGGMWSETECRVDPRVAAAQLARWLHDEFQVTFCFSTAIREAKAGCLTATDGRTWNTGRILICSGSDLQGLFPQAFKSSGLRLCKLQMLKTHQPRIKTAVPHLASGLTLRHYQAFEACTTLAALRQRVATETPELDTYGIHVMASHFPSGDLILGDSHEYDGAIEPFDKAEIDGYILRELRRILHLGNWNVTERWHGFYAKHPTIPVFQETVDERVDLFVGTGGAGMTLSFALAEYYWKSVG